MAEDDQRSAPNPEAVSFDADAYAQAYRRASRLGMAHLSAVGYAKRHAYVGPDQRHVARGPAARQ